MPSYEVNVWAHYVKAKQSSVITENTASVIESATCTIIVLGLSVLWADRNIGADSPTAYGDYFAWGETKPKNMYLWSNYKYANGDGDKLTKYCTKNKNGKVDNKKNLNPKTMPPLRIGAMAGGCQRPRNMRSFLQLAIGSGRKKTE